MAQFTATSDTYLHANGIREFLSDMITDISPTDTPFMSNIGKSSVTNTYFEWLTDSLAAAVTNNNQLEGDDLATVTDGSARIRLGNYTQISRKTVAISGTHRAVNNAGLSDELAYAVAKMGRELKRDMETMLCGNYAANAGGPTTARQTAGFEAFIRTNDVRAATNGGDPTLSGSTSGYPNAAATDGTQAAFTEGMLKSAIQKVWTAGGTPKMAIMGPVNKGKASAFTGIADIRKDAPGAKPATIVGAADVYVSDFGNVTFTPSRFSRERSVLLVDPEYAEVAYLRPFELAELAKTGDADKRMLVVEYGLKLSTEAAHGVIADLTTS